MDIYQEISRALNEEYKNGSTQQEIADRAGISSPHVCRLLSNQDKVKKLELATFFKLFPKASINLSNGDRAVGNQNTIQNSRVQSDNNFLSSADDAVEQFRRSLMDEVIDTDMDDTARIKILKLIKNHGCNQG